MVREPCPLHQPQLVCPCPSSRGIVKLLIGRRGLGLFSQLSCEAWLSFGSFSQLSQGVIREIVETARLVDDMLVEISGILKPEARPPQIVKRHVPRSSNTRPRSSNTRPRSSNGRLMQLESQPTGIDRDNWRFVTITGARYLRQSGWWRSDATEKQRWNWYVAMSEEAAEKIIDELVIAKGWWLPRAGKVRILAKIALRQVRAVFLSIYWQAWPPEDFVVLLSGEN